MWFSGPPSPPTEPLTAKPVAKDTVELSWQPPESDGGSPITGYLIEKREKIYSRWTQVEKTADGSTTAILKKLVPGSELSFRVSAVNKMGTSDALEMTRPVTVKSPFGKWLKQTVP